MTLDANWEWHVPVSNWHIYNMWNDITGRHAPVSITVPGENIS